MPEHEMPFTGHDDAQAFYQLDHFTRGYVQAIFFTEVHGDNPELQDATFADLAPETLEQIKQECAVFQKDNETELTDAYGIAGNYDDTRAGVDFWLTRNHHGTGYWDHGLGEAGQALTDAAHAADSRGLYKGDDGKLYLM